MLGRLQAGLAIYQPWNRRKIAAAAPSVSRFPASVDSLWSSARDETSIPRIYRSRALADFSTELQACQSQSRQPSDALLEL